MQVRLGLSDIKRSEGKLSMEFDPIRSRRAIRFVRITAVAFGAAAGGPACGAQRMRFKTLAPPVRPSEAR